MKSSHDVIVIGAGSVGLPTAMYLAEEGLSVLVVEGRPSPGQGENKAAIGGVRATHSDAAKILLCSESLSIFTGWKDDRGSDLGWKPGGYCFPVYRTEEERKLKSILPLQKSFGLDIDWVGPDRIAELIPGVNRDGLIGGTHSPGDGQVSPLKASAAFFARALELGVDFVFGNPVTGIAVSSGRVASVKTKTGDHPAGAVVIAAGSDAAAVGRLAGVELPVNPDSHEAGITAPMEDFLAPLVVDMRPGPEGRTANFYFGQNDVGAVIFCYTPSTLFPGTDHRCTSEFMPVLASRMISLLPRMRNALVRRVWRGCYPMTPDGIPIIGPSGCVENLWLAVGMCGQGFMLGPGVGKNLARWISSGSPIVDMQVMESVRFGRDFGECREALK